MKGKTMKLHVIGLALIASYLCGCGRRAENTLVTVGTWKTQQTIQPFLYERFLPKETDCDVKPFTNPGDMKTALLAGSLDMCGTTLVHAILSSSRGDPIVLVASLCNKCSALVVGTDSGIRSAANLKGKRIGYVPSTMHHILLLSVLHKADLKESDVTLLRVDFFDMMNALSHKQIDAFLSGEPFPTRAAQTGVGRILSYPYFDDSVGSINAGMIVRRDYLEQFPERVAALVQTHADATRHLQEHPDEWVKLATTFGNDETVVREAAPNIELVWDMDKDFVAQVKCLGQVMLERGMIDRIPDWDSLIETRFVSTIREEYSRP